VDIVNVFFTVTAQVDAKALLSWQALTNGEYLPGNAFEEGKGRVRCGVKMGYGGGSSAANKQANVATLNGFVHFLNTFDCFCGSIICMIIMDYARRLVAYGKADATGITLETDQLPVVNK
jgi:hypothetical protein